MQQVVRRRVIVKSNGRIQFRAPELLEGTTAEVLVIVEADKPRVPKGQTSELHESISAYAAKHAGSEVDLDLELEAAAVEFLADERKGKRR
jgi:hypothetical protein